MLEDMVVRGIRCLVSLLSEMVILNFSSGPLPMVFHAMDTCVDLCWFTEKRSYSSGCVKMVANGTRILLPVLLGMENWTYFSGLVAMSVHGIKRHVTKQLLMDIFNF